MSQFILQNLLAFRSLFQFHMNLFHLVLVDLFLCNKFFPLPFVLSKLIILGKPLDIYLVDSLCQLRRFYFKPCKFINEDAFVVFEFFKGLLNLNQLFFNFLQFAVRGYNSHLSLPLAAANCTLRFYQFTVECYTTNGMGMTIQG